MEAIFNWKLGLIILSSYGAIVWGITAVFGRIKESTKDSFLVANRKIGPIAGAFSIAATWIWAPALFVSSSKAYLDGWMGLFWFTVPNIACLIIFSYFANMIREKCPDGFTLSGFVKERTSNRVQKLYIFELLSLSTCSFAVQLLAAGLIMQFLTDLSYHFIIIFLAVLALSYSLFFGLKSSIVTDYFQMIVILGACLIFLPDLFEKTGGFETIKLGLAGTSGKTGWEIFLGFGIPVTIGLLSGPFGDQSFWQRSFAIKKGQVQKAFVIGAFVFGIVPICLGLLGFMAAGTKMNVANPSIVNAEVFAFYMPKAILVVFLGMILSGLVSTLDSCICAFSSIFGHDINGYINKKNAVLLSKISMCALCTIALLITYIPGIKIVYLFLFYGTLRSSVLLPTILILKLKKLHEQPLFWGISTAIAVGLPIFAFGQMNSMLYVKLTGSFITVLTPGLFYLAYHLKRKNQATA